MKLSSSLIIASIVNSGIAILIFTCIIVIILIIDSEILYVKATK